MVESVFDDGAISDEFSPEPVVVRTFIIIMYIQ